MTRRLKRGDIVRVRFYDHVENGSEPLKCTAYGWLSEVNRKHLCVDAWVTGDSGVFDPFNDKRFTIIRKAIHQITVLIPEDEIVTPEE